MTDQTVRLDVSHAVATITLNRPEVLNALDLSTAEALAEQSQLAKTMTEFGRWSLLELDEGFAREET